MNTTKPIWLPTNIHLGKSIKPDKAKKIGLVDQVIKFLGLVHARTHLNHHTLTSDVLRIKDNVLNATLSARPRDDSVIRTFS